MIVNLVHLVRKIELSPEETELVVNTLVYDGRLEEVYIVFTDFCTCRLYRTCVNVCLFHLLANFDIVH